MEAIKWDEIKSTYTAMIAHGWPLEEILPVLNYITDDSNLGERVFAYTSLDKLVISIYHPIEPDRESLHIKFDQSKRVWEFKYYPVPYQPVEHERAYPGNLLLEKFKNYISRLNWQ